MTEWKDINKELPKNKKLQNIYGRILVQMTYKIEGEKITSLPDIGYVSSCGSQITVKRDGHIKIFTKLNKFVKPASDEDASFEITHWDYLSEPSDK